METHVNLNDLRPNNWYINCAKLERVREAWLKGEQDLLPPILISEIDGTIALIDGHSRAYAAYENGQTRICADLQKLEDIEGSRGLYEHIHRAGPSQGIRTIADLASRIVSPQDHQSLWINWCTEWLERNGYSDDSFGMIEPLK